MEYTVTGSHDNEKRLNRKFNALWNRGYVFKIKKQYVCMENVNISIKM